MFVFECVVFCLCVLFVVACVRSHGLFVLFRVCVCVVVFVLWYSLCVCVSCFVLSCVVFVVDVFCRVLVLCELSCAVSGCVCVLYVVVRFCLCRRCVLFVLFCR